MAPHQAPDGSSSFRLVQVAKMHVIGLWTAILLLLSASCAYQTKRAELPRAWFVSPSGSASNPGGEARPLSIAAALGESSPVRPGDSVYLLGGVYPGPIISHLRGTEHARVTVRPREAASVVIDGVSDPLTTTLSIHGAWTDYIGLEIRNTADRRAVSDTNRSRGAGVEIFGSHVRLINNFVHDAGQGIGFWLSAQHSEVVGNVIYGNGWLDTSGPQVRRRGHGIYAQNETGLKRIADNIVLGNFGFGLHIYGSSRAHLNHFRIAGNIVGPNGRNAILLGGNLEAIDSEINDNVLYSPLGGAGGGLRLGYIAGCDRARVLGNVLVARVALSNYRCPMTLLNNRIVGHFDSAEDASDHPSNDWWESWSATPPPRPVGTWVTVRVNPYDTRRAHIAVLNWDSAPTVNVDLRKLTVEESDWIVIRDASDYRGAPVWSGWNPGRPVELPMLPRMPAALVGTDLAASPLSTRPVFAAFVAEASSPKVHRHAVDVR